MSKLREKVLSKKLREYISKALECVESDLECDVTTCYLTLKSNDICTIVNLEKCVEEIE